jgi:hypothetical protein
MPVYYTALLVTIAVEFFVYLIFIRQKALQLFLFSILINCLTQPIAYYFYSEILQGDSLLYFIIIEIIVFLAEGLLIKLLFRTNFAKAFLISFSANIVTALLSFIL